MGHLHLLPSLCFGYQQSEPANVADVGMGMGYLRTLTSLFNRRHRRRQYFIAAAAESSHHKVKLHCESEESEEFSEHSAIHSLNPAIKIGCNNSINNINCNILDFRHRRRRRHRRHKPFSAFVLN
jgi:hypothetical protein